MTKLDDGIARIGRPTGSAPPTGDMRTVAFRVDEETYAAIERLADDVESEIAHGRKSIAVRRAIMEADRAAAKQRK